MASFFYCFRQPCPMDSHNTLMVFDGRECRSPAISSNATTDDVCNIAIPIQLIKTQEARPFQLNEMKDVVVECHQARSTIEEETCLKQEFNCEGSVCISNMWSDSSSCSGLKYCKVRTKALMITHHLLDSRKEPILHSRKEQPLPRKVI